MTEFVPELSDAEWTMIAAFLPRSTGIGRPRKDDRRAVGELLLAEALRRGQHSLRSLYGRPRAGFLSVRRQRWQEAGIWPRVLEVSGPARKRLRKEWYAFGSGGDLAWLGRAERILGW